MSSSFEFPRFVLNDYYLLNIYLTPEVPDAVVEKYKQLAETTNTVLEENSKDYKKLFDAGIDLFNIKNQCVTGRSLSNKIDLGINCSMMFVNNSATERELLTADIIYILGQALDLKPLFDWLIP